MSPAPIWARRVDRADDPDLAAYLDMRERDLRGRDGVFVAEGAIVLRVLLSERSLFRPVSVLASEGGLGTLLAMVGPDGPGCPVLAADQATMDRVAGFHVHRGLLGLGRRDDRPSPASILPASPRSIAVGLVGLANHDNVGSVFRNAAAFGADAVLLDGATCDPLYRKAIRVSAGTVLTVPFARAGSADDLVDVFEAAGYDVVALSPAGSESVERRTWAPRTAILVGAEGAGLPPGLLGRLRPVRIAMVPGVDSLNVAAAAAIALHAARAAGIGGPVGD